MDKVRKFYNQRRRETWAAWANAMLPSNLSGAAYRQNDIRPCGQAARDLREARTDAAWYDADGYFCGEDGPAEPSRLEPGHVRIKEVPDESADADFLEGDMFNSRGAPDINPERLEREREQFWDRVRREGVWGYVSEYWDSVSQTWEHADSIFGFVGFDDFKGSGYDTDLKQSAIDGLAAARERWARTLESERPDMYALA